MLLNSGFHTVGPVLSDLQSARTACKQLLTGMHTAQISLVLFFGLELLIVPNLFQVQNTMYLLF